MTSDVAPLILVVDDEGPMRRFLRVCLSSRGFRLVESETGADGLIQAATRSPDVILLDLGLPDMDGLEVTRRLREWSNRPVIVLSARGQEADKVAALDAGADDYLTKPFGVEELLARIRVALRHRGAADAPPEATFETGELRIDHVHRVVTLAGHEVHLTPIEYRLLSFMTRNAGRVLTHRQLLVEVWGPGYANQTQYLRVFMLQLRRKLERDSARPRFLRTEPGVGYRFQCVDPVP